LYLDSRKHGLSQRDTLANNLRAKTADEDVAVHAGTMVKPAPTVKPMEILPFTAIIAAGRRRRLTQR
jgi:hypothetical protein